MITHAQMVEKLAKSGENILKELNPQDCDLMHSVMGVSGEAGELLDAVKKHIIYRKQLDLENIKEELGDLEFFMERLRWILGLTREEILKGNMDKLAIRYGKDFEYTNTKAVERADK